MSRPFPRDPASPDPLFLSASPAEWWGIERAAELTLDGDLERAEALREIVGYGGLDEYESALARSPLAQAERITAQRTEIRGRIVATFVGFLGGEATMTSTVSRATPREAYWENQPESD